MRQLLLGIFVILMLAACGGSEGAYFDTTDDQSTATSAATEIESTSTVATTKPHTDASEAVAQKKDPEDQRKNPGDVRNQALSKTALTDRTGATTTPVPSAPPADRGDDPRLDALWNDCAGGDMAACDTLYREAPSGSVYEQFGDTCGGSTAGGVWCSAEDASLADPYLDDLWTACGKGDWAACDSLYLEAPIGSVHEEFGATCGGITDGSLWCVDEFVATDPYLDGLWDACAVGDWAACDSLYVEAPIGSAYEEFGATCGGITDGSRWCTDEFGSWFTYGDDPYLDGLWDSCAAGDWAACDALYSESPAGSDYEEFGGTCGYLTDGSEWCTAITTGDPYTYGDDTYFDGLWDSCAAGDWAACDALYSESPAGSDYEEFGNTCGYLTDGSEWCTATTTGDPYTYGDDAYFDGLWDSCAAGDWAACDALYSESPAGSEYEEFGNTCGYLTDGSEWCAPT